jgi:hypothetical protein
MHHARDREVFERDPVVTHDQIVRQFVEVVLALVRHLLVTGLQHHHGLAPVAPAVLPTGNPSLCDS